MPESPTPQRRVGVYERLGRAGAVQKLGEVWWGGRHREIP